MFGIGVPMHPSLQVVTGMITPAILILAAGSLVSGTLVRVGRIVDNIRALIARGELMRRAGNDNALRIVDRQLDFLLRRSDLARTALVSYYTAISLFLLSILFIGLTLLHVINLDWLGPSSVMLGGVFLFAGSAWSGHRGQHLERLDAPRSAVVPHVRVRPAGEPNVRTA